MSAFIADSVEARLREEARAREADALAVAYREAAAETSASDWEASAGDGL